LSHCTRTLFFIFNFFCCGWNCHILLCSILPPWLLRESKRHKTQTSTYRTRCLTPEKGWKETNIYYVSTIPSPFPTYDLIIFPSALWGIINTVILWRRKTSPKKAKQVILSQKLKMILGRLRLRESQFETSLGK
jgi:hypothetical protein